MRCNAYQFLVGWGKTHEKLVSIPARDANGPLTQPEAALLADTEVRAANKTVTYAGRCEGLVRAEVRAVEYPEWGGTHAELRVQYNCALCGSSFFHPDLPDEDNLSDWLSNYIAQLPND